MAIGAILHRAALSAAMALRSRKNARRLHHRLLVSPALHTALALASLPLATASAQVNCANLTAMGCIQANQQYQLLQSFAALPNSAAGLNVMRADMATVESIYLNATVGQRNQAAANSILSADTPQQNLWGQIAPSSQILSTLQAYPQLQASAALATALSSQIPGQLGVYSDITALLKGGNVGILSADAATTLKDHFTAYAQAFQGQSTQYAWPSQVDPRPYQISSAIANAPWIPGQASRTAIDIQKGDQEWGAAGTGFGLQNSGAFPSGHSTEGYLTSLLYAVMLPQAYQSMMISGQQFALSRNIMGVHHTLDVIGARLNSYYTMAQLLAGDPNYILPNYPNFAASVASTAAALNAQLGPTLTAVPYAGCASDIAGCIASGTIPTAAQFTAANQTYAALATYGLPPVGPTNAPAVVPTNAYTLIQSRFPYLSTGQLNDVLASTELPSGGPLDDGSGWVRLNLFAAAGGYGAFNSNVTVTMDASLGGFNALDVWSNNIGGPGGLTKLGSGMLILAGDNSYTGGTTVGAGTLALTGTMIGNLSILPNASFVSGGGYSVSSGSTLNNSGTFQSVNVPLLNRGRLLNSGTLLGDLSNAGSASNTGTVTGSVSNSGAFANNGLVTGNVANFGNLSGTGTLVGTVNNYGVLAPGNSIGTLTVNGSLVQNPGSTYQPEVNSAGQSDRINVVGTPGTTTIDGATVNVIPQLGVYGYRTSYTLLNAGGGVAGTYAGATSSPFLQPTLRYDANNVYLDLRIGGFAAASQTANQYAVGAVLDANAPTATGDFATVIGTLAPQGLQQGLQALNAISGQNYSGFSNAMVQGAQLFMSNFASQAGTAAGGSRVALAEACDVACDTTSPGLWGAWGGALGGTGTIAGNGNAGALTYSVGGFAAGLDRSFTPHFLAGVTVGYQSGGQWTGGFEGRSTTDTVQAGLYGSYAEGAVYLDGLAGYAYSANQMWRNINILGLQPRTAYGQAGANQFYGQVEGGYRVDIGGAAAAFVTPFARLQGLTATQNGFTETGAQSLNLSVAQQTTNSLRSVLGAQLGGAVDLGWREKLALQLRLGWSHEYADTARPVSATLAGAPTGPFTTYGASPQRDGVLVGLAANTAVADAASLYLRYEGNIAGQDSSHALTAGLRMTW